MLLNNKGKFSNQSIASHNHVNEEPNRFRRSSRSNDDELQQNYPYVIDKKIYLELMVVVDKKMREYYGDNLENHIQTLLFLVCNKL